MQRYLSYPDFTKPWCLLIQGTFEKMWQYLSKSLLRKTGLYTKVCLLISHFSFEIEIY